MIDNKILDMKKIIQWNNKVLLRFIYEINPFYTGAQILLVTTRNMKKIIAKEFHLVTGTPTKIISFSTPPPPHLTENYGVPILIS